MNNKIRGSAKSNCVNYSGQERIAELLLNHGAEIDLQDGINRSALHWASRLGRFCNEKDYCRKFV